MIEILRQDGSDETYTCSPRHCGYSGDQHCQNCGFASGETGLTKDWWVDGHYVGAANEKDAWLSASVLYDFEPEHVRPWTDEDQMRLDEQHG